MSTNPFAGMQGVLGQWARGEAGGIPGANFPVLARNVKLYSRKNIGVGANAPISLRFFDESPAPFVQTIVNQSQLPANMALVLHSIRFGFTYGLDRLGRRLGLAAPSAAQKLLASLSAGSFNGTAADLLATQWRAAETIREFMSTPTASFGVSTNTLWTVSGLLALPDGKGSLVQAGLAQTSNSAGTGLTADIVQSISNGAPVQGNMWNFTSPWPLAGTENFTLQVDWPRGVDFTDADVGPLAGQAATVIAGTLTAELQGVLAVVAS